MIRPASASARKQWQSAVALAPDVMAKVRDRLCTKPLYRGDNPRRTARLRGSLATRRVGDSSLPQWQHEITGAGRIWYCPDLQSHTVWVTHVTMSHPKATE